MPGSPSCRQPQGLAAVLRRRLGHAARARTKKGLTQEKLGWASGLHQTEIARIERGTRNPGLETIVKLARGLEVRPADLLKGIE